jgi:hypothetical protein
MGEAIWVFVDSNLAPKLHALLRAVMLYFE